MIDKSWTVDEAIAANEAAQRDDPNYQLRTGPLWKWSALQKLDTLEKQFYAGNGRALLNGIAECALTDTPLPEWVAREFLRRIRQIRHYEHRSWDDVFGSPFPKNFDLPSARLRWKNRLAIYLRICELRKMKPDTALDDDLFAAVGKEFGVSRTVCKELYYQSGGKARGAQVRARSKALGIKRPYRRRT